MRNEMIFIPIFVITLGIIICVGVISFSENQNQRRQIILDNIDVQFTGSIINKETKKRFGRSSTIICVDIHNSNKISFSILNKDHYIFLKIKDNIASFAIPTVYNNLDSIAINMNNNRMEQYYLKGKLIAEYPLSLSYAYLNKQDLEFCFR